MPRLIILALGACLLCLAHLSLAKTFSRCELVKELRKQGFPENELKDWVCLIETGSGRRTDVVSAIDGDSLVGHNRGLFLIPDDDCILECDPNDNGCDNDDFLTDDITKAADCAKKIHKKFGFNNWEFWGSTKRYECEQRIQRQLNLC